MEMRCGCRNGGSDTSLALAVAALDRNATMLTEFHHHQQLFQKALNAPHPLTRPPSDSPDPMAWADDTAGGRDKWEPRISKLRSKMWLIKVIR